MANTITVYLDTQDYSRFGDVIRGVADQGTVDIYRTLLDYKKSGRVIFPFSMSLMSELIQYREDTKEICFAKAEAIEALCGEYALPYPTRLMAMEISLALREVMGIKLIEEPVFINENRYWYPNVDGILIDFKKRIIIEVDKQFSTLIPQTFTQRRKMKSARKKLKITKIFKQGDFSELERQMGIPEKYLRFALIPLIENRISSREAVHRLFEGIAKPQTFIEVFFERYAGDSSAIPAWISGMGRQLKENIENAIAPVKQFLGTEGANEMLVEALNRVHDKYKTSIAKIGYESLVEFVPDFKIKNEDELPHQVIERIKSANLMAAAFDYYMKQVLGLKGRPSEFERSVAGDLVHLLYLPHVDLWRGDKGTSNNAVSGWR
jgi:hypothetical protein